MYFSWIYGVLQEIHKENFAKIAKPLTLLTHQQAKLDWTQTNHSIFLNPEGIHYPSTNLTLSKSKETLHSLYRCIQWQMWSTTFLGTWWYRIPHSLPLTHIHWYSMEMEYHRTRGLWCILCSHKVELLPSRNWNNSKKWPQATSTISKWKNANNKVNRWGLELATYNITFEWISGACNKAADYLSHLVELPQNKPLEINMLSATHSNGPAFNTRSRTVQQHSSNDSTPQTDTAAPVITETGNTTPKSLSAGRLEAPLQMQKTDPFCEHISRWLSKGNHQNTRLISSYM